MKGQGLGKRSQSVSEKGNGDPLRIGARDATAGRRWAEAAEKWRQLLEADPTDLEAIRHLADTLRRQQLFDASDALLTAAMPAFPDELGFDVLFARNASQRRDHPEALRRWSIVLARQPELFEARLKAGIAHQALGQWDEARRQLDVASTLAPDHPELLEPLLDQQVHDHDAAGVALTVHSLIERGSWRPASALPLMRLLVRRSEYQLAAAVAQLTPPGSEPPGAWGELQIELDIGLQNWSKVVAGLTAARGGLPQEKFDRLVWRALRAMHTDAALAPMAITLLFGFIKPKLRDFMQSARQERLLQLELDLLAFDPGADTEELRIRRVEILATMYRLAEARDLAAQLLKEEPDSVARLGALEHVQSQAQDWKGVIETRERMRALRPDDAANHLGLAAAYRGEGDVEKERDALLRCLAATPLNQEVFRALGALLAQTGQRRQARSVLEGALAMGGGSPEAAHQLGLLLESLDEPEAAAAAYRTCLSGMAWHADAFERLRHLEAEGRIEPACAAHLQRLRDDPQRTAREWALLAHDAIAREAFEEGRALLEEALRAFPGEVHLLRLLAFMERVSGRAEQALAAVDQALAVHRYNERLWDERLQALCAAGRFDDADRHVAERAEYYASAKVARRAVGLLTHLHFGAGRIGEGFATYRGSALSTALRQHLEPGKAVTSLSEVEASQSLLVLPAWGIGDEINWSAAYPQIATRGARVTFGAEPRLFPLLRRSFPELDFMPVARWQSPPALPPLGEATRYVTLPHLAMAAVMDDAAHDAASRYDRVAIVTDLMADVRPDGAAFQRHPSRLVPDPARLAAWRGWLEGLGRGPRIGIAWTSSRITAQRRSHLTRLADWDPVLRSGKNAVFVSLQPGDAVPADLAVHRPDLDAWEDLDGLAALIGALDLVISVVNSTAELAGAVGTPTWLLNRSPTLQWRIADAKGHDLIHPASIHLRAEAPHDVESLMRQVAARLDDLLEPGHPA